MLNQVKGRLAYLISCCIGRKRSHMKRIKTSVCEKLTAFNVKSKATANFIKSNGNI